MTNALDQLAIATTEHLYPAIVQIAQYADRLNRKSRLVEVVEAVVDIYWGEGSNEPDDGQPVPQNPSSLLVWIAFHAVRKPFEAIYLSASSLKLSRPITRQVIGVVTRKLCSELGHTHVNSTHPNPPMPPARAGVVRAGVVAQTPVRSPLGVR